MLRRILLSVLIVAVLLLPVCAGARPVQSASANNLPASVDKSPAAGPRDPAELAAFLDGVFAAQMAVDHVSGAVVAVVRDGQVLYERGYGYSDVEKKIPVDPKKTLFRPGSISKLFVWTAVMQLVEQGKLSLDADINTYLDYKIPATYPQPITLRHLMTHTPGFEDAGQGLFKLDVKELVPLDAYLKTHIPARVYAPGTVSAYSNYGAATAGYIVERVSGLPFSDYVEKNIFQPLGMTHTTFRQPLPATLAPDMARGYNYTGGQYLPGPFEVVVPYPAGSLSATADDLTRFMIAHLQNGRFTAGGAEVRLLSEATAKQMHSPLFRQDPRLSGMAYGFFEEKINGQQTISHGGDTILFHSGLWLLPDQNVGFYVSTNALGGSKTTSAVFQAFMDRYYPVAPLSAPPAQPGFTTRAAQYSGEYYMSRSNYTSIEKLFRLFSSFQVNTTPDGHVVFSGLGFTFRYSEAEPGRLVTNDGPLPELVLKTDPSGQVSLLTPAAFSLIKAPWYATGLVQLVIFIGGLLLFLVTLIVWLVRFFRGLRGRRAGARQPQLLAARLPQPLGARLARIVAGLFMLIFIVFLLGLIFTLGNNDPVLGQPRVIFESASALAPLLTLPWVLGALGLLTLPFAVLAWWKCYWSVGGRVFYSLLAAWFLVGLWAMWYWNML